MIESNKTYGPYTSFFAADLLPMHTEERLASLAESIRTHGQREPIHVWGTILVDGRNRWRACEMVGVEPRVQEHQFADDDEAVAFVADLNLEVRDMDKSVRAHFAAGLEEHYRRRAKGRQEQAGREHGRGLDSSADKSAELSGTRWEDEAGREAGTSGDLVRQASDVRHLGSADLNAAVSRGEISVGAATVVARTLSVDQQDRVLESAGLPGLRAKAAQIRRAQRAHKTGSYGPYRAHTALSWFPDPVESLDVIDAIAESIQGFRQVTPIVVSGDTLVDGRLRWLACEQIGVDPIVESRDFVDDDAIVRFIVGTNGLRGHLSPDERLAILDHHASWSAAAPVATQEEAL